jgi:hypothetical protein
MIPPPTVVVDEGNEMALTYGFIKCKLKSGSVLKASRHKNEIQYHIHTTLQSNDGDWDSAINVGTNDADDLLRYKLVYDYRNSLIERLRQAARGFRDLMGTEDLPALDFVRSEILDETGGWRDSDVMDGSKLAEPVASLRRLYSSITVSTIITITTISGRMAQCSSIWAIPNGQATSRRSPNSWFRRTTSATQNRAAIRSD